jgi:hypothetical protein
VRLKAVYAVPALVLATGFSLALGGGVLSEHGPIPSYTGAPDIRSKPAELDCTLCHFNFEWNNLNTPGGSVEILDLPPTYTAGLTYRLRVRLTTDSTAAYPDRDWGFQLTAVRASDGEGCGTFILDDADTLQIVSGALGDRPELASRSYVEHTILGDRDGIASPVEWTFSWKAPDTPEDTALFFCAGNATNGNLDPTGDFIFTAAETLLDLTTPVKPVSWGALKKRYR